MLITDQAKALNNIDCVSREKFSCDDLCGES